MRYPITGDTTDPAIFSRTDTNPYCVRNIPTCSNWCAISILIPLQTKHIDLEAIIQRIGELLDMTRKEVLAAGKNRRTVHARSLLCYLAVEALGMNMTTLSTRLDISVNAVSKNDSFI